MLNDKMCKEIEKVTDVVSLLNDIFSSFLVI